MNPYQFENLTEKSFGAYIRMQRKEQGISVRCLATQIGVSAVYLSDIERCKRSAPKRKELIERISIALKLSDAQQQHLYSLSLLSRFEDIEVYLKKTPVAQTALRIAIDKPFYPMIKEWEIFISRIKLLDSNE